MEQPTNDGTGEFMTAEEFEALAKTDINAWLNAFLGYDYDIDQVDSYRDHSEDEAVLGLHIKEVYSEGGCEGGGEHAEVVFAVKKGEDIITHFRILGSYGSYSGTEWDTVAKVVEPREVLVTHWFDV